MIRGEWLFHE